MTTLMLQALCNIYQKTGYHFAFLFRTRTLLPKLTVAGLQLANDKK